MKTIQRKFTHPSDGLEMTYDVDVYAPKGTLLLSTIRGEDLGHKQATGKHRTYNLELHDTETFQQLVHDGVTFIPPYIQRWPGKWLPENRPPVSTPRILENFISANYIISDDDSGSHDTVDFWLTNEFFASYGFAFIESSSSTKTSQKGHPMIRLDTAITDREQYEEAIRAFIYYFQDRVDASISSANELSYNKKGSTIHLLNNICPLSVYHREFIVPYRDHIKQIEIQRKRQREKRRRNRSNTTENYDGYIYVAHKNLIEELASVSGGSGLRQTVMLKVGRTLAGLAASDWHNFDTSGWQDDIMNAATTNGYVGRYGKDSVHRSLSLWDSVDGMDEPN